MASCVSRQLSEDSDVGGYVSSSSESSEDDMDDSSQKLQPASDYTGHLEVEVFENTESEEGMDIEGKMESCTKNPGHGNFIHVGYFKKRDLPEKFQRRELVRAIKTGAELTVRVFTNFVSHDRPETYPNSKPDNPRPYPWFEKRGKMFPRVGTGWIWKIEQFGEGSQHAKSLCHCEKCKKLPDSQKKKTWWQLIILTATHVVFDESECEHTWIDLWDEIGEKNRKVRIRASAMGDSPIEADRGMFTCVTHDEKLFKQLLKFCRRREEKIEDCNRLFEHEESKDLTVVISHPHGDKKRISIGYGQNREDEEVASYFHYDTPTCNGSSGGFVWAVGWGSPHGCVAPHSWGGDNNFNRSGSSWPLS